MITPVIIEGDIDLDLQIVNSNALSTSISVTALSERFQSTDAVFEYRISGGPWRTDAVISDSSLFGKGSALFGIPCSPTGSVTSIFWNHAKNGLTPGSSCDIRLNCSPSRSVFSWSGTSAAETISWQRQQVDGLAVNKMFGLDKIGNWMGVNPSNHFEVSNSNGVVFTLASPTSPRWAQQTREGLYLVLFSDNMVELNETGTPTARSPIDLSAIDSNLVYFCYSPVTKTMLLSGRSSNTVAEITWGVVEAGTVLDTLAGLNLPFGACYHEDDQSIWLVADEGNNRIAIADRIASTVTSISSVIVEGTSVPLSNPRFIESQAGGRIGIIEAKGVPRSYSSNPASHPALARLNGEGPSEFRNFLFAPVLRSQD